jgi:hypothetical protein
MHQSDIRARHGHRDIGQQVAEIGFVEVTPIQARFRATDDFGNFRIRSTILRVLASCRRRSSRSARR